MNNELKKLYETRDAKKKEMEDLVSKVKLEERAFTDEENTLFDELEKEIKNANDTIDKINKSRNLTAEENDGEDSNMEKEDRALTEAEIEERDIQTFANYIRNELMEVRDNSGMTTGDNGVIVPTTIANKIITKAFDLSPILGKATQYNVKGNLEIPVYGANAGVDITVGYQEDFKEIEEKAGKFASVKLTDYLIGALALLGKKLVNNSDVDLVSKVIDIMAEYFQIFLEGQAINGSTNKIQGLKGNKNIVKAPALTYDVLVKTKNSVKQAFRKNAIWIMNQDTQTFVETMKDNTGKPLFQADPTGLFDGKILGYPVYISDNMDGIETGKRPIQFGDFSGLAVKTTKDLEIDVLREKYATQHAIGILGYIECDMNIEHEQKIASLEIGA